MLGFGKTPATFDDVPDRWKDCAPINPLPGARYRVTSPGTCTVSFAEACPKHAAGAPARSGRRAVVERGDTRRCPAGMVARPSVMESDPFDKECPHGYAVGHSEDECREAASLAGRVYAGRYPRGAPPAPGGCLVRPDGSVQFHPVPPMNRLARADVAMLCRRCGAECAKVGSPCGPVHSDRDYFNYRWQGDGTCGSACAHPGASLGGLEEYGVCRHGERCEGGRCAAVAGAKK